MAEAMKIITDTRTLYTQISEIEIQTFKDVLSGITKLKGSIRCHMKKDEYEHLEVLHRSNKWATIVLPDDLKDFGITTFYPPFDIRMLVLRGEYVGNGYKTTLYFSQP